ncbi:hypothetical protein [Pseudomonas plecoglossicida]|uniref:hypothetical protein n=1 Tax=Pseudomonas plecoglossicida TaxID=70775 RepID=UPI003D25B4BC
MNASKQAGQLNPEFNKGQPLEVDISIHLVRFTTEGGVLLLGDDSSGDYRLIKYDGTGKLDQAFNSGRPIELGRILPSVEVDASGRILLASRQDEKHITVQRYKPDGILDADFGEGGSTAIDLPVNGVSYRQVLELLLESRALYLSGYVALQGDIDVRVAIRVDESGKLDVGFAELGYKFSRNLVSPKYVVDEPGILAMGTRRDGIPDPYYLHVERYDGAGEVDRDFGNLGVWTKQWDEPGHDCLKDAGGTYKFLKYDASRQVMVILGITSDGKDDQTFGSAGRLEIPGLPGVWSWARSVGNERADYRFIHGSGMREDTPDKGVVKVCRTLRDGSPDDSFGTEGTVSLEYETLNGKHGLAWTVNADGDIAVCVKGWLFWLLGR